MNIFTLPMVLIIVVALCRGASFLFIKYGVDTIPVFTLVFMRVALASAVLIIYSSIRRIKITGNRSSWMILIIIGIVGNIMPFSLVAYAEKQIDSGIAGLIIGMVPLFVYILAYFFAKDETINRQKIIGVLLGFIGLGVIYYPDILKSNIDNLYAIFAVVLSAIAYAIATLLAKRVSDIKPEIVAAAVTGIAAIILIPFVYFEAPDFEQYSYLSLASTLALGIISTAIPFVIMYGLIASQGATYFTINNYLIPLVALVLGVSVANEEITKELLIATCFILVGIYLCITKRFNS